MSDSVTGKNLLDNGLFFLKKSKLGDSFKRPEMLDEIFVKGVSTLITYRCIIVYISYFFNFLEDKLLPCIPFVFPSRNTNFFM